MHGVSIHRNVNDFNWLEMRVNSVDFLFPEDILRFGIDEKMVSRVARPGVLIP